MEKRLLKIGIVAIGVLLCLLCLTVGLNVSHGAAQAATADAPAPQEPPLPEWAVWTLVAFAAALVVGIIVLGILTRRGKKHTLYYFYSFDKEMITDTVRSKTDLTAYFNDVKFRIKKPDGTTIPAKPEGVYTDHHYTHKIVNPIMPNENYVVFLRFVADEEIHIEK